MAAKLSTVPRLRWLMISALKKLDASPRGQFFVCKPSSNAEDRRLSYYLQFDATLGRQNIFLFSRERDMSPLTVAGSNLTARAPQARLRPVHRRSAASRSTRLRRPGDPEIWRLRS
jgi:hypothetical protein